MGTKTQTSTQNQYAPGSMAAYQSAIGQAIPGLENIAQNPFTSSAFNTMMGLTNQQALQQGGTQMNALLGNLAAGGFGGQNLAPFLASQAGAIGRGTSGLEAQGMYSNLANSLQRQMQALGGLESFNPLQTGQQTTQQTSGLGTWLPQVAGMGLNAAGSLFGHSGFFQGGGTPYGASSVYGIPMGGGAASMQAPNVGFGAVNLSNNPLFAYGGMPTIPAPANTYNPALGW